MNPRLKQLIQMLVEQAISEQGVQPKQGQIGKGYLYKEQIMQMVQAELRSKVQAGAIKSQADYEAAVMDTLTKIRSDFDLTFSMIERTIKQVPYQALGATVKTG